MRLLLNMNVFMLIARQNAQSRFTTVSIKCSFLVLCKYIVKTRSHINLSVLITCLIIESADTAHYVESKSYLCCGFNCYGTNISLALPIFCVYQVV